MYTKYASNNCILFGVLDLYDFQNSTSILPNEGASFCCLAGTARCSETFELEALGPAIT